MEEEYWGNVVLRHLEDRFKDAPPEMVLNEVVPFILTIKRKILYPSSTLTDRVKSTKWFEIEERIETSKNITKARREIEEISVELKIKENKSVKEEVIVG